MDHEIDTPVFSTDSNCPTPSQSPMPNATKIRPPFPTLAIFNVAAIILSYVGYRDGVQALMNLLCNNTHHYFIAHKEILKSFIVEWRPVIK